MVHMDDMTHRRAVSPVIATVILIAVAVAIGIAVAFWASGLTTSFSKYEQLGVNAGYATASGNTYTVIVAGSNTGSSATTINQVQINGVPVWPASVTGVTVTVTNATVNQGGTFSVQIVFDKGTTVGGSILNPGSTIEVALITASGTNYPKAIVLP